MTAEATIDSGYVTFVRSTSAAMMARAVMMCGNREDAEDAVQEAYLEAFRRWDRLASYDSPRAWIHTVMSQRLWKAQRRGTIGLDILDDLPSLRHATPAETAEATEVLRALDDLPRSQRIIVLLHCVHGHSQAEVAELLGVRRGTVAASLFQARRTLRRMFAVEPHSAHVAGDRLFSGNENELSVDARMDESLRMAERLLCAAVEADPQMLAHCLQVAGIELPGVPGRLR